MGTPIRRSPEKQLLVAGPYIAFFIPLGDEWYFRVFVHGKRKCVFTAAARGAGRRGAVGSPRDVRGVAVVS
jgi:hypothetical protein